MSRRKIQAGLFQIVRLAIFVKPPKFAEEVLISDLAFSYVAFRKRTVQSKEVSVPLSFLLRRVSVGVDVPVVRQLFLESSGLAASNSVKGIELINALGRLFHGALSRTWSRHGERELGLYLLPPASWRLVAAD